MSKLDKKIKIGNKTILVDDYIYISKLSTKWNLYAISQSDNDKPLFIISAYFAALLLSKTVCVSDGFISIDYLNDFLKKRKVVFKNCYYDLAYKGEIKEEYMKDIIENQDLFRFRG